MPNENGDYIIDDMVLTESQVISYFGLARKRSGIIRGFRSGIPKESARWPNRTLPYQFDDKYAFSNKEKKAIWQKCCFVAWWQRRHGIVQLLLP